MPIQAQLLSSKPLGLNDYVHAPHAPDHQHHEHAVCRYQAPLEPQVLPPSKQLLRGHLQIVKGNETHNVELEDGDDPEESGAVLRPRQVVDRGVERRNCADYQDVLPILPLPILLLLSELNNWHLVVEVVHEVYLVKKDPKEYEIEAGE